jgi:hypothetical protein
VSVRKENKEDMKNVVRVRRGEGGFQRKHFDRISWNLWGSSLVGTY